MSDLLRINLEKTADGLLAQYPDRPEIIVSGRNRTEIKKNLKTIMAGCVEAFPETRGSCPAEARTLRLISVKHNRNTPAGVLHVSG